MPHWSDIYLSTLHYEPQQCKDDDPSVHQYAPVHIIRHRMRLRREEAKDQGKSQEGSCKDIDSQSILPKAEATREKRFVIDALKRYASNADCVGGEQRRDTPRHNLVECDC